MTNILIFIFILSSAFRASALPYQEIESLDSDRLPLAQLVRTSVAGLRADLNCSLVFVGKTGEAITNLHCIEQCLIDAGATTNELAHPDPVFIDPKRPERKLYLQKKIVSLPKDGRLDCPGLVTQDGKELGSGKIDIVHIFGPGFLYPKTLIADLTKVDLPARNALVNSGFEGSGDMVLIKVQNVATNCLIIDFANFDGDPIPLMNLAYTRVLRNQSVIGDRKRPIVSMGYGSRSKNIFSELDSADFESIFPIGTILTSTDAEIGASGSPLLNQEGKLIAIVRATNNQGTFQAWSTHAISLAHHKAALLKLINEFKLCQ